MPPDVGRRARLVGLGALALLALALVPFAAGRLADWLWYRDLGFERVFLTKIAAQWALGVAGGLAALVMLVGNVRVAFRGAELDQLLGEERFGAQGHARAVLLTRLARVVATPAAIQFAVLAAFGAARGKAAGRRR
jgi:uncharacterized membrane protein (UPF0182 family)